MMNPDFSSAIRSVPDFPKKGIVFRDITTLLKDRILFKQVNAAMAERYRDQRIDKVVGIESRGFILGASLAAALGAGFVPIRKKAKLPAPTLHEEYSLEYGTDSIEIHKDAIVPGERILIHDDLLATGGTIAAACNLVERLGGTIVGIAFLIELTFLHGRSKLHGREVFSLVRYDRE
ncbi:MAG TPA: adenine phosphoribosyltransferase [Bacteroidota bacterium]|nr:adenine phosphoribosyltransferase [Bacteroidota bacterium]